MLFRSLLCFKINSINDPIIKGLHLIPQSNHVPSGGIDITAKMFVSDAGVDFITCESVFTLTAARSYDVDWNGLSYSWSLLDGSLEMEGSSSRDLIVTSPIDLDQSRDYSFELIVTETISGQEHCSDRDTVKVTIKENICPIADAGGDKRIPKFENRAVVLNASSSFDPDGNDLTYVWIGPDGSVSNGVSFEVSDLSATSSYTKYNYQLQVTDAEGAISVDYIDVIFSDFSAPSAPKIFDEFLPTVNALESNVPA